MASTGPTRAQTMEAIQKQHEAILTHNMLFEKNLRIQELEVTERLWKEEQKTKEQQEREERLASSPWRKEWGHMKQQRKQLVEAFAPKMLDGGDKGEEDKNKDINQQEKDKADKKLGR